MLSLDMTRIQYLFTAPLLLSQYGTDNFIWKEHMRRFFNRDKASILAT